MKAAIFKPHHMNATKEDIAGNNGIGRYFILPGSDGRAKEIAEHFEKVSVKHHDRGHNLYLGTLTCNGEKIDVATISTGMGCPSMEIILHELFQLGAKRFLRIGTAGSLQPNLVKIGDIVNAQASVRDEDTTTHYAPIEIPAIASLEVASAILLAGAKMNLHDIHTGIVHCKSSLYAREFGAGPRSVENEAYINLLRKYGVLASEMETSALFVQSQVYNHELMEQTHSKTQRVLAGAILAIIASVEEAFHYTPAAAQAVENGINLAIETVKTLAIQELID